MEGKAGELREVTGERNQALLAREGLLSLRGHDTDPSICVKASHGGGQMEGHPTRLPLQIPFGNGIREGRFGVTVDPQSSGGTGRLLQIAWDYAGPGPVMRQIAAPAPGRRRCVSRKAREASVV